MAGRDTPPYTPGSPRRAPGSPRPQTPGSPRPQTPGSPRPQTPGSPRPQTPGSPGSPRRKSEPQDIPRRMTTLAFDPPILSPLEVPTFSLGTPPDSSQLRYLQPSSPVGTPLSGRKSPRYTPTSSPSFETPARKPGDRQPTSLFHTSPRVQIDVTTTPAQQYRHRKVAPDYDSAKQRLTHLDSGVTFTLAPERWTEELRDMATAGGMVVRDVDDDGKSLFEAVYAVMYYLGHQEETCGFDLLFRLATFLDKPEVRAYLRNQVSEEYTSWRDGLCTCDRRAERQPAIVGLVQLLNIAVVVHHTEDDQSVAVFPTGGQPVCTVQLMQLVNSAGGPHFIPLFPDSTPSADIRSRCPTSAALKAEGGIGPHDVKVIVRQCLRQLQPEAFGAPLKEQAETRLKSLKDNGVTVEGVLPFLPQSIIELGLNPVGVVKGKCELFNAVYTSLFYLDRQDVFSCGEDISMRLADYLDDPRMRLHFSRLAGAEYDQWLYGLKNTSSEGNKFDCFEALAMMLRTTIYVYQQGYPKVESYAISTANVPPECTLTIYYTPNARISGNYICLLPRPRNTLSSGTHLRKMYEKYDISDDIATKRDFTNVPPSSEGEDVPENGHVKVEILHPEVLPDTIPKPQAFVPPSEEIADEILSDLFSIQKSPPDPAALSNYDRIRDIARCEHLFPFTVDSQDGHSLFHAVYASLHYASYTGDFQDGRRILDALLKFLNHPFVEVQYRSRFRDFNSFVKDLKKGKPCNYAHALQALAQCFCMSVFLYGPEKIQDRVFYPTNKTSICSIAISQRGDGAFFSLLPHFNLGSGASTPESMADQGDERTLSGKMTQYRRIHRKYIHHVYCSDASATPDDYYLQEDDYQRIIDHVVEGNDMYRQLIEHRGNINLFPMLPMLVKQFRISADEIRLKSQDMESEIHFATRQAMGLKQRLIHDGALRPDQEAQIRDYLSECPEEAHLENTLFVANRFRVGPFPVVELIEEFEWENKLKKQSEDGACGGRPGRFNIIKRLRQRKQ